MPDVMGSMVITFDDGTEVPVEPKMRDTVAAEAAGHDFTKSGPLGSMYATAYAALKRMQRLGTLPDGVEIPVSLSAFLDLADVTPDAEGNG